MECPSCGRGVGDGALFCGGCGASLSIACPACGRSNPGDDHFCQRCGARLDAEVPLLSPAPGAERKQVTVVFADVVGSMALSSGMDPEEWSELMERLFAVLREGVNRFEGRIDKFTGDGVMALFGAPVACEDHARRGCAAALHLRE